MFNQKDYSEIKNNILKISKNKSVSFDERIMLQGYINKHSDILHLFKKAQCARRLDSNNIENLTKFLTDLSFNENFQEDYFNPHIDSIEDWFNNTPNWLRRS